MEKNLSGILVVDKPPDMTSAKVVAKIKKWTGVHKIGHTGTLDPFATGVLVCCVNKATRLARFFTQGYKKYDARMCLGQATDTQDATGAVIHRSAGTIAFSEETLTAVFNRYKGKSEQHPPVYSALKFNGVPLYKLARAGKAVQKPPRQIEIADIRITRIDMPFVRFEVICSAGTYIRTLCADIGNDLGCGGHLQELRRTASGGFSIDRAIPLTDFEALVETRTWPTVLINMSEALGDVPIWRATEEVMDKIKNGVMLGLEDIDPEQLIHPEGLIQVIDSNNNLIAVLNHEKQSPRFSYCCVLINN